MLQDFRIRQVPGRAFHLGPERPEELRRAATSNGSWPTRSLENVLKRLNIEYKTIPGEAAFYGPKIDVKLVDAIGRLWQLSTVQFDFNLPAALRARIRRRRRHAQAAADGASRAVRLGRALLRRADRALRRSVPRLAVADAGGHHPHRREARRPTPTKLREQLKAAGVRVHVDARNEKMNAKIREHAMQKVPFLLVVGDREMEAHEVNVRVRGQEKAEGSVPVDAFVERVKKLIKAKSAGM